MTADDTKSVRLAGRRVRLTGVRDDIYFRRLRDDQEFGLVRFCAAYLPSDAVCLDIGANIGVTALALSEIAANGHVVAVEPSPSAYPFLLKNLAHNGCRNVQARQLAIAEADGEVQFFDCSAYGFLVEPGVLVHEKVIAVPAARLETLIAPLPRLDFVKLDIEGFEFRVLRQSCDALKRFDPLIFLEFNSWCLLANAHANPFEFLEWLFASFGFVAEVNGPAAETAVTRLSRDDLRAFLHRNMMEKACVSDLVVAALPPQPVAQDASRKAMVRLGTAGRLARTLHRLRARGMRGLSA